MGSARQRLAQMASGVLNADVKRVFNVRSKWEALHRCVVAVAGLGLVVLWLVRDQPNLHGYSVKGYRHAAVSTDAKICSEIGVNLLRQGGSAVDAAIGSALCIGVVSSHSAGIGGGGMMVIYNGTAAETIDSRETAPAAATERMFADFTECAPHGGLNDSTRCPSRFGGLSVAVPGELRGFEKAHQRHGKLPWRDVLAPTIILCRDGFRVTGANARAMWITHSLFERVGDEMRSTFTRRGDVFQEGDLMRRPRLARTLALVAERGADAFYTGPVAENTIDTIMHNSLRPGIMTLADLAGYQPIVRDVTSMAYQGNTVLSAPPPASGAVLGLILNILEGFDLNCIEGPSTLTDHRIVEAMKFGYGFRSLVADPCCDTNTTQCRHVQASVAKMLSKPEGRRLQSLIRDGVTHHNPQYYGGHFDVQDTPGTTHISVVGPAGDAVAFTSTINTYFGSKLMTKDGILLNNEMDDFSNPSFSDAFGVPPSPFNFVGPKKRPLSSAAPTIVINPNGEVQFVAGAAGGSHITTAVAQVALNVLSFCDNVRDAVDKPRLHHQLLPDWVGFEDGISQERIKALKDAGHSTRRVAFIGVCQAIARGRGDSKHLLFAASDGNRKRGAVATGF